jgi:hypothetical protein
MRDLCLVFANTRHLPLTYGVVTNETAYSERGGLGNVWPI